MAIFEKDKLKVIVDKNEADLSNANLNINLSIADFNSVEKYFYISVDKVLFSNPVATIRSILDLHGFVANLENILSCLDSLVLCIHAKVPAKTDAESLNQKVSEYLPCLRFEMPQKNKVGEVLQKFYDELSKHETRLNDKNSLSFGIDHAAFKTQSLNKELKQLKKENAGLQAQVESLTQQLIREQKSLSRASRALDSQQMLPENTRICRVEDINLKKRIIKVKLGRKLVEIPTHILDRIPEFQARCLITFDENESLPLGVLFFDNQELANVEKRTAKLLYVEGNSFKARDSERNEFQIKALNEEEAKSIESFSRGMNLLISIANGYVIKFSNLDVKNPEYFIRNVDEQMVVYNIGRNQLVGAADSTISGSNE